MKHNVLDDYIATLLTFSILEDIQNILYALLGF